MQAPSLMQNICIQNICLRSQFWKLYVDSLSCSLAHFAVFPFLSRVFSLPLATLLINFSSSLTLHLAIEIKKRVCNGFLFPGNLGAQSVTLRSPVVLLVCGSRVRDNLLAWGKLFANPYELKSHTRVWEEYNHFERFYRVCRLDRFFSNFAKTSWE